MVVLDKASFRAVFIIFNESISCVPLVASLICSRSSCLIFEGRISILARASVSDRNSFLGALGEAMLSVICIGGLCKAASMVFA